ncbi:MAG TPA: cell wall hydrolase [Azospirillaceae bacterium]|nr:cell wall hydrolase [Azospirillaceae bacterium]
MRRRTVAAVAALAVVAGGSFYSALRRGEDPAEAAVVALAPMAPKPAESAVGTGVPLDPENHRCLAQTIYHEARGEPEQAQRAVAAVVLNRVRSGEFPKTVCEVIRQGGEERPCQFSWYCDGRSDEPKEPEAWERAMRIAHEMAANPQADPTNGALYFHHEQVHPDWRYKFERTAQIGEHMYYRGP